MSTYEMWFIPYTYVSDSTGDTSPLWTLPMPEATWEPVASSYSRQTRRFQAQIARRRGRLLALEVALAMKGDSV